MVLVCEDQQHQVFARRFLKAMRFNVNQLRTECAPAGRGSGAKFVVSRFPKEVAARRQRNSTLLVLLDADEVGREARLKQLLAACRSEDIALPASYEPVYIFTPRWNIETWIAYLGGETVDESKKDYPRLDRPKKCQEQVTSLTEMCRNKSLRHPSPLSLVAACKEFERFGATIDIAG